jgi:glycosyltransferase involved in cell wall biosynthesis
MISVIIPAFNECDSIASTIARIKTIFEDLQTSYELIVIDDGSTDGTGQQAESAGAKLVHHPLNMGYGRSLKDGIRAATYETIVITDADGSYPLESIPQLLTLFHKGYDMVVGARTGDRYDGALTTRLLRWTLKCIVEFTAGRSIPDINSGLRVFNRSWAMNHFNRLCDTFSFTTSLTLACMMKGGSVAYLPIPYHARIGTSKVHLFRDSLRTLQYVAESATYYNPLKIFTLLSFFCLFMASLFFTIGVVWQLKSAFAAGVGCILLSILVFAMGLLAVLLKQIMDRPG